MAEPSLGQPHRGATGTWERCQERPGCGTFVPLPPHDVATRTEALRRAGLRLFVSRGLLEAEPAVGMLAWPHSGFQVHDGVWVPVEDRACATRLARSRARHRVALGRLA